MARALAPLYHSCTYTTCMFRSSLPVSICHSASLLRYLNMSVCVFASLTLCIDMCCHARLTYALHCSQGPDPQPEPEPGPGPVWPCSLCFASPTVPVHVNVPSLLPLLVAQPPCLPLSVVLSLSASLSLHLFESLHINVCAGLFISRPALFAGARPGAGARARPRASAA
jgi:hypothetical protein